LVVTSSLGCSCDEEAPPTPAPPAPPPPEAPVASPRPLSTVTAFDLAITTEGAALVYGPPISEGGGLRVVPLDAEGGLRGEERVVHTAPADAASPLPPDALEIAIAAGGGRLGVVWIGRRGRQRRVLATHGDDGGEAFAPAEDFGEVGGDLPAGRGGVTATAAADGAIAVTYRLGPARCVEPGRVGCVRFGRRRLGGNDGASERSGMALVVPTPCPRALLGQVWVDGVYYSGVCSSEGDLESSTTTVYAIQFDPQYARAEPTLRGCEPLGLAPFGAGVVALGRCPGRRLNAFLLSQAAQEHQELIDLTRRANCVDGRPDLELAPASGIARRHALAAPASRIEVLLDDAIAPAGSRAVWTGRAVLVAVPLVGDASATRIVGREVSLHRYQCREGSLVRTNPR
jgi:hypothetical protein